MASFLIVRLGALGDIIHALPVAAALRAAFPEARVDWLAAARHHEILDLVPPIDCRLLLSAPRGAMQLPEQGHKVFRGASGTIRAVMSMRGTSYDAAFDLQGLIKSAALARLSGARRVVGFSAPYLRERPARFFYSETVIPSGAVHVVDKNLTVVRRVGIDRPMRDFPLLRPASAALDEVRARLAGHGRSAFALLNPGAGWPNKRWPTERFGSLASTIAIRHGLPSVVLWGRGEERLARAVADRSNGAAFVAPRTSIADLVSLVSAARLMVAGDTGPLHIAAAVGTPIVGIYGPTDPARNGPWSGNDVSVSRFASCECHHKRRCRRPEACILDITVDEVSEAVDRRLAGVHTNA
ncbi:MAG: glycosyltransferase family 9 protein [Vicinamibacterales bacterium]